jgi:hypothetical protein
VTTVDPAYLAAKRAARDPSPHLTPKELDRLMANVQMEPTTGCWLWTGPTIGYGYGLFSLRYKNVLAHKTTYQHFHGPVPPGLVLDHEVCDTPQCCNPDHVRPKTQRENLLRGNTVTARNAAKTACPKGHPLVEGNLVLSPSRPGRICLTCRREYDRRRRPHKPPRPARTVCAQGHALTPDSTYQTTRGERICRACVAIRNRKNNERKSHVR